MKSCETPIVVPARQNVEARLGAKLVGVHSDQRLRAFHIVALEDIVEQGVDRYHLRSMKRSNYIRGPTSRHIWGAFTGSHSQMMLMTSNLYIVNLSVIPCSCFRPIQ